MGVIAAPRAALYGSAALYAVMLGAGVLCHEPWADEAQSWLLARDSGLVELWTRLLHYEGSPGLWHTLLHLVARAGLPYAGMSVVAALIALGGVWLLLRYSPLPLALRLLLPFTFFLGYQYAVVARSYVMLPALLFACAALYCGEPRRLTPLTTVLCAMAAVSVHGLILSASICAILARSFVREWPKLKAPRRRCVLLAAAVWVLAASLFACSAWPAGDGTFVTRPFWSAEHLLRVADRAVTQAFTGFRAPSWAAVALSVPFLWRGGGLLVFTLAAVLLCAFGAVVYSQVWHHGIVFLAWLFALWVAAARSKPTAAATAAAAVVVAFQCYAAVQSLRYDWNHPYSGGYAAARHLREAGIHRQRLFAVGYACTAVQPYFPRNIFANLNGGGPAAFWDWSVRNHANRDAEYLGPLNPDYVLVGYKGDFERDLWTRLVTESGYRPVRHFEGNLFWRTRILEPESFDLYRRLEPHER